MCVREGGEAVCDRERECVCGEGGGALCEREEVCV